MDGRICMRPSHCMSPPFCRLLCASPASSAATVSRSNLVPSLCGVRARQLSRRGQFCLNSFPTLPAHASIRLQPRATSQTEPTRAILVGVDFGKHDFQESLSELALLTTTAGSVPVHTLTGKRSRPIRRSSSVRARPRNSAGR
jgi:hypothetical protein